MVFLAVPPGTESEGRDLFADLRSIGKDDDPRCRADPLNQ